MARCRPRDHFRDSSHRTPRRGLSAELFDAPWNHVLMNVDAMFLINLATVVRGKWLKTRLNFDLRRQVGKYNILT